MPVSLPDDYIGKEVHVLFYIDDELKRTTEAISQKKRPSDFFGTLSKSDGEKMKELLTFV